MGHANFENISTTFVDLLCKQESITIRQVVDLLVAKGEVVHASEGDIDDRYMLSMACEEVLSFLLDNHGTSQRTPERKKTPVVEPVEPLTERQETLLQQFYEEDTGNWDSGDEGEGGDFGEFDMIPFRRTSAWAKIPRNRIPLLCEFES